MRHLLQVSGRSRLSQGVWVRAQKQAVFSTGEFGTIFEELRSRVQQMTRLTKRCQHVLHTLVGFAGHMTHESIAQEREAKRHRLKLPELAKRRAGPIRLAPAPAAEEGGAE